MRLVSTVAGGDAGRGASLQISEIRFSSTESTKLRVIASVKRRSTRDKLRQLGEVRAKGAERELSIKISPSSIIGDGEILVAQVYRRHRLLLDERLLKEEFSFQALLKYCSGESKSKVYEILNKRGITIRAKLGAVPSPALETSNKADDVSQHVNADQSASPRVLPILAPVMDTNGAARSTSQLSGTLMSVSDASTQETRTALKEADARTGSGKVESVISNLSTALKVVQQVGNIIESVPFIAPIGAILSELVKVYKEVKDTYDKRDILLDKVASLARDIGGSILELKNSGVVERVGRLKTDLEEYAQLLGEARNLVIRFDDHGKSIHMIKRGELGALLDALDKKLDFFGTRFRSNRSVDMAINLGKVAENIVHVQGALVGEERTKIINWLSPINFFERQQDIFRARQPGTGEKLLIDQCFKQWKASSGDILWCKGMPGAGKTVFASIVVNHLETTTSREDIAVACMYLNHKETQIQTPSNLLAALWRQLVFDKPTSVDSMGQKLYRQHFERGTRPSLEEIHELLCSVVAKWSRVFIVVDALDEYPEDERMILLKRLTTMESTVNIMLTSRPHITLPSLRYTTNLEIRAPDEDIRKYVNQRIQAHSRLSLHVKTSPELREQIITTILKSVDGMFLLAKLHTESLVAKTTVKSVRETLENLPKDLDAAYKNTMDRINQQQTGDKELALAALTWIANAKRVLTVAELREALAVKAGAEKLDPDDRPDISIISDVCAGLIIFDNQVEGMSSKVRLVHYSTQKYLDGIFPEAHTDITRTLLTYLALGEVQSDVNKFQAARWSDKKIKPQKNHPLFDYCGYCLVHAVGKPEVQLQDMILKFLEAVNEWYPQMWSDRPQPWNVKISLPFYASPLWVAAAANLQKTVKHVLESGVAPNSEHELDGRVSALCVASFLGHGQIVKSLLDRGASTSRRCRCSALRLASQEGHIEIVRTLLENGVNIDAEDPPYGTALQSAIEKGHTEIVHLLIEQGADVTIGGWEYGSALQVASARGQKKIIPLLLQSGADVNAVGGQYGERIASRGADVNAAAGKYGTALYLAAKEGHTDKVLLLLEKGANVNEMGETFRSALAAATAKGYIKIVRLLLERGADVNSSAGEYGSPLYLASEEGHTQVVRLLLEKGANVNKVGGEHGSAFQAAVRNGHTEIVRLLAEKGADVKTAASAPGTHHTALYLAAEQGYTETVQLLLDNSADVNATGGEYGSALQAAIKNKHTEIARLLLQNGASANSAGNYGTALYLASTAGHIEIVDLLLHNGANVNAVGGAFHTALSVASKKGYMEIVRLLLEKDASENSVAKEHDNALQLASEQGHMEIVRLLLESGADVNSVGDYGTALYLASAEGHKEIVRLLLDNGADINATGGVCGSALAVASNSGHTELVHLLLENGADINSTARNFGTALYLASEEGHQEIVRLLLEKGANANVVLAVASKNGHTEIVHLLLKNGADVNAVAKNCSTALYLASKEGHIEMVRLLIENGAHCNGKTFSSALLAATKKNHTDVVRFLREKGAEVKE
ncbi:ANK-REP-REGION domain-containing protein [Mycena venus]|uniref:ANK-REP-REGION domain-containing protein n=1 Tax=Mycena venus TaxID=2733690 RepID=A0A8H6YBF9_9AGAR|nr:ANK-REP-REGION domain-containing protein [Mycena venus]